MRDDYEFDDDEPYVVIERQSAGIGSFLVGAAIGAGIALLFAPKSGVETRREIKRSANRVKRAAQDAAIQAQEEATRQAAAAEREANQKLGAQPQQFAAAPAQAAAPTPSLTNWTGGFQSAQSFQNAQNGKQTMTPAQAAQADMAKQFAASKGH